MATIFFMREGVSVDCLPQETILGAARRAGLVMDSPCGGNGTCGKCTVEIIDGLEFVVGKGFDGNLVRACCTSVCGDVTVLTPWAETKDESCQILKKGTELVGKLCPGVTKSFDGQNTTVVRHGIAIAQEMGDTTQHIYGYAVDIGTTTLVGAFVDYTTGLELASTSAVNPQCVYAQDVIGRIHYATTQEQGLETLYQTILKELNGMLHHLCEQTDIRPDWVYEAVYSGNGTMVHLTTNTDPSSMGHYPYTPAITGGNWISAKDNGLNIAEVGQIYLPPLVSAFVGADITSGILACQLLEKQGNTLFLDIGTNGEMVLASNGTLVATSTAAGPAFEGMNITFGMRASAGAIDAMTVLEDGQISIGTIQNAPPIGICGSGLFDVVAELVRLGIVTKTGKFAKAEKLSLPQCLKERMQTYEGKPAFLLGGNVYLTQLDLRQIQLAKGAICAGVEALLEQLQVSVEEIDQVIIAGSFGYHLRRESIVGLGILPKGISAPFDFVGNSSKSGGIGFLVNPEHCAAMERAVSKISCVELSHTPNFEQLFVQRMTFERVEP